MAYSDIDSNKVLNKEGLLELCSQIKTEIANNSGSGGSTYTAGKNITIDANNTINAQPEISAWILQSLLYAGTPFENEVVELNSSNSTTDFINALQAGKLIYIRNSVSWSGLGATLANLGYTKYIKIPQITVNSFGYTTYNLTLTNQQNWKPEQPYYYQAYENTIFGAPSGGLAKWLRYYSTNSGLSAGTIWDAIDELAGNVATKFTAPTAPTTDGQYKLTSTITSGASTYSWEADTGSTYTLPTASTNTLGGVKVDGSTITISDGVISAASSGGASYTAGTGISIDSNDVISANMNPLIHSMVQMTTAGNDMPGVIRLTNTSTWEEFVDNVKAGKIVYVAAATSYTFSADYKLTPALLGITTLRALNIDAYSIAMMSPNVSSYPATGTQIYYQTYYYFDGDFLWSWKKPEDLGNFIKVHYRNSNNTALGYALKQITDSIDGITGLPTPSTTDGTYVLQCVVSSGTPTYSWVSVS